MSADEEPGDGSDEPESSRPERNWNLWIWLALLAFATYEFTAQAPLSLSIVCLKFGMNDLSTGVWLRRRDPRKLRGKACFWFYVALGLAKASAIAFAGIIVCAIWFANQANKAAQGPPDIFVEGGLVMLFASLAATFCVLTGLVSVWRGGGRVWIASVPATDRRADIFPPNPSGPNQARWLIMGTFIIVGVTAFMVLLVCLLDPGLQPARGQQPQDISTRIVGTFAVLVLIVAFGIWLSGKACARWPEECWRGAPR